MLHCAHATGAPDGRDSANVRTGLLIQRSRVQFAYTHFLFVIFYFVAVVPLFTLPNLSPKITELIREKRVENYVQAIDRPILLTHSG